MGYTNRRQKGWLFELMIIMILLIMVGAVVASYQCRRVAKVVGYPGEWDPLFGCRMNVGRGKLVPVSNFDLRPRNFDRR